MTTLGHDGTPLGATKLESLVTSNHFSSQSWPCPHPATGHVRKQGTQPRGLPAAGNPAAGSSPSSHFNPPAPAPTQRGASRTRWRGPGVGDRVPSSATVAAQPDSRNLLARGHLWASGKSLSSSSGTDIQQQDGTTMHPLWPAPRAAAGLPPCQGDLSPQPTNGAAKTISLARPGGPRERTAFLAAPGLEWSR